MLGSQRSMRAILPVLFTMMLDAASSRAAFPILAVIFFDQSSHLFTVDVGHATRSYWYGFCIAIPSVIGIFSGPLLSVLSDYWGRKWILFFATLGNVISSLLLGFAVIETSLPLLVSGFVLNGVFAKTNPISQAQVADHVSSSKKARAMAYLQAAISFGAFLGPILGGHSSHVYFDRINYAFPFFLAMGFAVIALFVILFFMKNHVITEVNRPSRWKSIFQVIQNKRVITLSIILFFSQLSWSMYYQFISPELKVIFHFSAPMLGFFVSLIAVWLVVSSLFFVPFLLKRLSVTASLFIGLLIEFVGFFAALAAFLFHSNGLLWGSAAFIAAGDVLAYCIITTLYSEAVCKTQQGQVMAVCFLIIPIAWSLSSLLGAYLFAQNVLMPIMFLPLGLFIALVYSLFYSSTVIKDGLPANI